jgi:sugar phosphate isomerase/epimerase
MWITKAGANPLEYFARYPGRFPLCHVKDMASDGTMVDVGAGIIDFATIFASAGLAGLNHYFVEHDQPQDPLGSVTSSYSALTPLLAAL